MTNQKNKPNYQTNLLDLIIEQQQDQQLRQLQYELPAAPRGHPRDSWELIFEHLGGKKRYYCVNCAPERHPNIITAKHISKHQAIEEAYDSPCSSNCCPWPSSKSATPAAGGALVS